MHAKDLFVDNGGNGQAVETIGKGVFHSLMLCLLFAFVIEAIDTIDARTLVVSA